jgi:hypothetical protein
MADHRNLVFYYPNPIEADEAWIKTMILFFDGIAILLGERSDEALRYRRQELVSQLQERGLLEFVRPGVVMDVRGAKELARTLVDLLDAGVLDDLVKEKLPFSNFAFAKLGSQADRHVAEEVRKELALRGLVVSGTDPDYLRIHPRVEAFILWLLSQILRNSAAPVDSTLWPATDRPELAAMFAGIMNLPSLPTAGHVIEADLTEVGVELGRVSIDELLDFRDEHGREFQRYTRDLREYVRQLALLPAEERESTLRDRRLELSDKADQLRRMSRERWKEAGKFFLSLIAGVGAGVPAGPIGMALGAIPALLQVDSVMPRSKSYDSFTYLTELQRQFS